MAAATPLKLAIEGMDCAACALKIETAMKRLPGVSDVNVSVMLGTLALNVDEERTLPIRLLPTPTKCRVGPFSRVEPVEGRRSGPAGDS